VLALVGAGLLAQRWHEEKAKVDRGGAVIAVTRNFLSALTNFQSSTIGSDVARIRSYAVGDFADQVSQFFGQEAIKNIQDAQARSVGHVQSVFVQRLSGATATVFGVVNEVVTNKSSPTPTSEVVRLNVQMIETAAGWKVSNVEILQSPGATPLGG